MGGVGLPRGERPYLVELRETLEPPETDRNTGLPYIHVCGATLIGERTVLTAARTYILFLCTILFLFYSFFF